MLGGGRRARRDWAERLLYLSFYPVGAVVELTDGSVGRVVATHPPRTDLHTPARPVVALLTDAPRRLAAGRRNRSTWRRARAGRSCGRCRRPSGGSCSRPSIPNGRSRYLVCTTGLEHWPKLRSFHCRVPVDGYREMK